MQKISPEDLNAIQTSRTNFAYMKVLTEKAQLEEKIAELQAKNTLLNVYLKYGLSSTDKIDKDGLVIKEQNESSEEA